MKKRSILVAFVALLLCVGVVGCANKNLLNLTTTENPSRVNIEANGPGPHEVNVSGSAITLAEGEKIVVTPNFSKGSLKLIIGSKDFTDNIYEDEVSGVAPFSLEAAPGVYDVRVTGTDDGAVGSLTISAEPAE